MKIANQAELETKAKILIRKRINVEETAGRMLEKRILMIFKKALSVAKFDALERNGISVGLKEKMLSESFKSSEMQSLFTELRNMLFTVLETAENEVRTLYNKEFGKEYPFLPAADLYKGADPFQRIESHTLKLQDEFKMWMTAGLALSVPSVKLTRAFNAWGKSPYSNPVFNKAFSIHPALVSRPSSGRVGNYTSAINSITRTIRYNVADASRRFFLLMGVQHFLVGRGSAYPCPLCEDMVGIRTSSELPPYHNRCCCWAYPIDKF